MSLILTRGAQGPEVLALRRALAVQLGEAADEFGGLQKGQSFDAGTQAAVRRWQAGIGLVADGLIGPYCQGLLGLRENLPAPLGLTDLRRLFPATKPANIERYWPYVAAALQALELVDPPLLAAALGLIRVESEGFLPISEYASSANTRPGGPPFSAYEGRANLGNTEAGDGARFKGRGFVQLTGRANYRQFGERLGLDLCADPDLANAPEVAALLLAQFLSARAGKIRGAFAKGDPKAAWRLVNGSDRGLERFMAALEALVPTPVTRARRAAPAPTRAPLNARKDSPDLRDRAYQPPPASLIAAFPSDFDVQSVLPRYVAAGLILNQGQEGACTGFGLACVVNHLRWRQAGMPEQFDSVSPRMFYSYARRYDEYAGEDYEGSSCRGALKGFFKHGVCLEADWPYADAGARPRFGYAKRAAEQTLGVYFRVELRNITDLQAAIQQVGAVYVSAQVHEGWYELPTRDEFPHGHDDLPLIPFDGAPATRGGHAFALVGFNRRGFVLQNSWGTAWGCGGFAVLSYEDWLANGLDAWVAALGVPGVVAGRIGAGASGHATRVGAGANWWSAEQAYQHSVVLGNDGRVRRYLTEDELSRTLLHQVADRPDQWFRAQGPKGPKRLLIYAHGGLNSEGDAIKRAQALGRSFLANGCYPLFVVWKTGLLETLGNLLRQGHAAQPVEAGIGEWVSERSDRLVEATIGRTLVRPLWSEMKENAGLAFEGGRGGELLITALRKLAETWGAQLEIHLVGHSAGSIWLGHLLSAMAQREATASLRSVHLYAPACTIAFANRHYAPQQDLMKRLYIDLLSDRVEREDSVIGIYRKSLLYLVSNALEADPRTPLLGLAKAFDPDCRDWDGSSATAEVLRGWRQAAAAAGLTGSERLAQLDQDKVLSSAAPESRIRAAHGSFDNDIAIVERTLTRICGKVAEPVRDLRGF